MGKTEVKSYWGGNHPNQAIYEKMFDELVPKRGDPESFEGKLLCFSSRLGYDFNNNGFCNFPDSSNLQHALNFLEDNEASFAKFLKKRQSISVIRKLATRACEEDGLTPDILDFDKNSFYFDDVVNAIVLFIQSKLESGSHLVSVKGTKVVL